MKKIMFNEKYGLTAAVLNGIKRNKKANGFLIDGKVCQEWPKVRNINLNSK